MGGRGDAKLQRLVERFEALARGQLTPTLRDQLAKAAMELIRRGFATSTDPYGLPWKPKRYGEGRPLVGSGHLRGGFRVSVSSRTRFRITNVYGYAVYHQYGAPASNLPRRAMVPSLATRGLPRSYRAEFQRVTGMAFRAHFRAL